MDDERAVHEFAPVNNENKLSVSSSRASDRPTTWEAAARRSATVPRNHYYRYLKRKNHRRTTTSTSPHPTDTSQPGTRKRQLCR